MKQRKQTVEIHSIFNGLHFPYIDSSMMMMMMITAAMQDFQHSFTDLFEKIFLQIFVRFETFMPFSACQFSGTLKL